jgi:hypothetical protein
MSSIALDTYKTIQKLQGKGFSLEQAEGVIEALTESELVTRSDLVAEMASLRIDVYRAMMLQTGAIVGVLVAILTLIE